MPVILVGPDRSFPRAERFDGSFDFVPLVPFGGGESGRGLGRCEGDPPGQAPVRFGAPFGFSVDPEASVQAGGRSQFVAVVVDQGVFGVETAFRAIELSDRGGGVQEGFQDGNSTVVVQVGLARTDRVGEVIPEPGVIRFRPAFRRGHDDPLRTG